MHVMLPTERAVGSARGAEPFHISTKELGTFSSLSDQDTKGDTKKHNARTFFRKIEC